MAIRGIEQRYEDFFQVPLRKLLMDHKLSSSTKGDGVRWHGFSSGFSGVIHRIAFLRGKKPSVRIVIDRDDGGWNKRLFQKLSERREIIEVGISASLQRDYVEGRRRCVISTVGDGDISDPSETWKDMQDWMVDRLLGFKRVVGPHLQELVE